MVKLQVDYVYVSKEMDKLADIQGHITPLPPKYRKLVAEIILLRTFSVFENTVFSVACKVVCGAAYCDNSQATILVRASTMADAETKMRNHGRNRPRWNLSWTRAGEIKENVRYLIAAGDHFMWIIDQHGTLIDERGELEIVLRITIKNQGRDIALY